LKRATPIGVGMSGFKCNDSVRTLKYLAHFAAIASTRQSGNNQFLRRLGQPCELRDRDYSAANTRATNDA
jgi:hypothetical protein